MSRILHSIVLGSVLSVSIAGPLAQTSRDNLLSALITNAPDQRALAKHRLTVTNVRQLFAVDRELLKLTRNVPDLASRVLELEKRFDPDGQAGTVVAAAKACESVPEIAQILGGQKIAGREYVLTKMVATFAQVVADNGTFHGEESDPSLQFWRSLGPALKAEANEWKSVREEMNQRGWTR